MKKKIIIGVISCVCIAALVFLAYYFGTRKGPEVEPIDVYRFDSDLDTAIQTIQNESLKLDFDPTTGQFVMTDKNGNVWNSNPQGPDATRDELKAMIVLTYQDVKGIQTILNSYADSVERGNYSYEVVDDTTIRVDYTVGKIEKTYLVPLAVPYARYEEIQANVSEEGLKEMKSVYRIYDIEKLTSRDNKEELLQLYPDLETTKVAVLRPETQEWKKEKVEAFLLEAGYTEEQYKSDLEYYGAETTDDNPAINLSVYLKLEGDDLVVSVPYDSIDFYADYPVTEIRILPYMCSASTQENGYMVVPDGSGAIINFNNLKTNQSVYHSKVYGWDYAQVREDIINDPTVQFPVYGIAYEDTEQSMLCIIEDGASYSYIEADVAGRRHMYNYVTQAFNVVHSELADVSEGKSNAAVYIYEEKLPAGESISVRYKTLDEASYVEMGKCYREYLLNKYPALAAGVSGEIPTAVELIGAVTKRQQILGIPKDLPYALSTYEEMAAIIKDLNDAGMTNLDVIINGWFNDGVKHDIADNIDLISKLGSKKDFKNMLSSIGASNTVFMKSDFTFVYNNSLFDSFFIRGDAGKFLSREPIEMQEISNIWYGTDEESDYYYVAKPSVIFDNIDAFRKDMKKFDITNIAFGSIGDVLAADYNRKHPVSRENVMKQQAEMLAEFVASGGKNIVYTGNEYAVPYADIILEMPLSSDSSSIIDEIVPFLSIALHGFVDYTGDAINITGDYVTNVLNSAEYGAGLYFVFMDAKTNELQETDYTEYFGASYASWRDDAIELYQRFKNDFASLYGQTIEDHEILDTNITVTEYADGTSVYVNYRTTEYTTENGVVIPAQDWVVVQGGGR